MKIDLNKSSLGKLSDIAKTNKIIVICYFFSCMVVSISTIHYFWMNSVDINSFRPIVAVGMIFIPWAIVEYLYRKNSVSEKLKWYIYISAFIVWQYLALSGIAYGTELQYVLLPLLVLAICYCRWTFVAEINGICVFLGIVDILIYRTIHGGSEDFISKVHSIGILIVAAIIFSICAFLLEIRKATDEASIGKERERFNAIVSVGSKVTFEYYIDDDLMMYSHGDTGKFGTEYYICHYSSVAKKQKYFMFADWYKLDEMLVECRSGASTIEKEIRFLGTDGEYRWQRVSGKVIFGEDGEPERVVGYMEDIDNQKRQEFKLADERMRDPLTKLYKKPYVGNFIDEYFSERVQDNEELDGFLIVEIDNYDEFVEQMGDAFGDEILKNIATDIQKLFYQTDIIGRNGRDEFVILMKNMKDVKDIEQKVKDIQKVLSETYIGEKTKKKATVCIGASVYPKDGNSYAGLYENAEKSIALAGSKGPNHYDIFNPIKNVAYSSLVDDVAKRRKKKASDENKSSYVSESLIETAFKLIEESKDTDSAINLLIRQIVRQLQIDAIMVRRIVNNSTAMEVLYHCGLDEIADVHAGHITNYSEEQWADVLKLYDNKAGMVVCNNIGEMSSETVRQYMIALGIEACAGCAFFDKGEMVGVIDYLDFNNEREWTEEEIKLVRSVTNIISSYLLKMKAYEDASATVERLTGYDSVTGLYKYEKFLTLTEEYLKTAEPGCYAFACADICNFKYVNDNYGYQVGDQILSEVAGKMLDHKDNVIMGSRTFSDNIVLLVKLEDDNQEKSKVLFDNAINSFGERVQNRFANSRLNVCVGVCTFMLGDGEINIQNLISNANMARKIAKQPDSPLCVFYYDQMGIDANNEIVYANSMEEALVNHEFVVYMQPKVNLQTNRIEGAEALVRWKKPDGKMIFPNDFIPVFERNRSITKLDFYVYEEVCRYLRDRLDKGLEVVTVSVNISRVHLYAIDELLNQIKSLLNKYDIPPYLLEFELTETSVNESVEVTIELMNKLKELGVNVSMDDFGSGYSSLNLLTSLPIDILKMDKGFLKDFESNSRDTIVIPSVIDMAKRLELTVVCEGAETKEQVEFLRECGCHFVQGYYYSKPIPQQEFDELLSNGIGKE